MPNQSRIATIFDLNYFQKAPDPQMELQLDRYNDFYLE